MEIRFEITRKRILTFMFGLSFFILLGTGLAAISGQWHPLGEIDFSKGSANANLDMNNNNITNIGFINRQNASELGGRGGGFTTTYKLTATSGETVSYDCPSGTAVETYCKDAGSDPDGDPYCICSTSGGQQHSKQSLEGGLVSSEVLPVAVLELVG